MVLGHHEDGVVIIYMYVFSMINIYLNLRH